MKYLLVLIVVAVGVWMFTARARPRGGDGAGDAGSASGRKPRRGAAPQPMLACARCGVHLPAGDAVLDGSRVYCSDAHRAAGPREA